MSKTDETFESAFPHNFVDQTGGEDDGMQIVCFGLSIRDYFAARAIPALLGKFNGPTDQKFIGMESVAKSAYQMADVMLEEREK